MRSHLTMPAATKTPQTSPMQNQIDQVRNSAGGYTWRVDAWQQLNRFLLLGTEGGTYHVGEQTLTAENANALTHCLRLDGRRVVKTVVDISRSARSPKNDGALFALALAASPRFADPQTNAAALNALPSVARTGTHLFDFVQYVTAARGWGRALRRAIAQWYTEKPLGELEHLMLKYQSRNGWSHADLLRLGHPEIVTSSRHALIQWALGRETADLASHGLWQADAFERIKRTTDVHEAVRLIRDFRLTQEMVPSHFKNSADVWLALLEEMPYAAMLRNLAKLTDVGLLSPGSDAEATVSRRLVDPTRVRRSRVHPVAILSALLVYQAGRGYRGSLQWLPSGQVIEALDAAFYLSFVNAPTIGERLYLAIDASASMQGSLCCGTPFLTAAMGASAMAMTAIRTEPHASVHAFDHTIRPVSITPSDRLDQACEAIAFNGGGTDASLPFKDAASRGVPVDAFIIYTDSETWAGDEHPAEALREYRDKSGINSSLIVVAMAANRYTIVDPGDPLQIDVAGFDTSVPQLIHTFLSA